MKIIILSRDIPFPLNSGHRIRTWNFIKALYESNNELYLLSFKNKIGNNFDNNVNSLKECQKYFKKIWLVDKKNILYRNKISETSWKISTLLRCIPRQIAETYSQNFERVFEEILKKHDFDVIFARYIQMGQYLLRNNNIKSRVVVDLDDLDLIYANRKKNLCQNLNLYNKFNNKVNNILFHFYFKKLKFIDDCIVCSEIDKEFIRKNGWSKNICVISNSIDVKKYNGLKELNEKSLKEKVILFCGVLNYEPNIDGLKWFVRNIFPIVKKEDSQVKLNIVGLNPHSEVYKYSEEAGASLYPNVSSVIPYYQRCSLVVVPIRFGSGTRVKIIEALACRRPVISTTIGAEGLKLVNMKHVVIQDNPEEFARACIKSLNDFDFVSRLTKKGYLFVRENYDIENTSKSIRALFGNGL